MPASDDRSYSKPLIWQMLGLLQQIRATQADLARLKRKLRVVRSGSRPLVTERTKRDIAACEQCLADLNGQLRANAPTMFSAEQCELPAGEDVKRQRGASGPLITLHGGQNNGLCRLTIANVGLSEPLDLRCRPQDVNLIGFLLAGVLVTGTETPGDWRPSPGKSRAIRQKFAR